MDEEIPGVPRPAENANEHEKLWYEVRLLRHRVYGSQQIDILHTELIKQMEKDLVEIKEAVFGTPQVLGLDTRVDRIEQRHLGLKETIVLWVAAVGGVGGLVVGLVGVFAK